MPPLEKELIERILNSAKLAINPANEDIQKETNNVVKDDDTKEYKPIPLDEAIINQSYLKELDERE